MNNNHVLWYSKPAIDWEESLPLGNGRMGAMVYGGITTEQFSLNEDSLWSGAPKERTSKDGAIYFKQARELLFQGKNHEAQALLHKKCTGDWSESFQPLGDLYLQTDAIQDVTNYKRTLDLRTAITTTEFDCNLGHYVRESFISAVDNVMIVSVKADKPFDCTVFVTSQHPYTKREVDGVNVLESQAPGVCMPDYFKVADAVQYNGKGIKFNTLLTVSKCNGTVKQEHGCIYVEGASEIEIRYTSATSFNGSLNCPVTQGKDNLAISTAYLQDAATKDCEAIKAAHIKDHQTLYNRTILSLGESEEAEATDVRLAKHKESTDIALEALLYHYGRYLMICGSREGTVAVNLQGIWNNKLRAPWSSNFTSNINFEMNYWPVETSNLSECHMPMFDYLKAAVVNGQKTAKVNYGCDGFTVHHNTDIWATTNPVGGQSGGPGILGASFWPTGGAWMARHVWEHYSFTMDESFLAEHYYIIKEACTFLYQMLYQKEDGRLYLGPSISPENGYMIDGEYYCLDEFPTMDIMIVQDLFTICEKSAKILGIEDIDIANFLAALPKLPPYKVGKHGELKEYLCEDYEEEDINHRHISHLYGLFPASLIEHDSQWADPCKTTLNRRGDDGTGWSLAWKINCWAHLHDGDRCHKLINRLLVPVANKGFDYHHGGTYPNMFSAHPPLQIDCNFGYTSGINEMLVQSSEEAILIAPALPSAWTEGSVQGIKARGNMEVSFKWKNGEIYDVEVSNNVNGVPVIVK